MYKGAHQNRQRRADFIPASAVPSAYNPDRDLEQQRQDLLDAINAAHAHRHSLTPKTPEWKAAGKRIAELCREMAKLPRIRIKADIGELLIAEMQKLITPEQYVSCLAKARSRVAQGFTKLEIDAERENHPQGAFRSPSINTAGCA